METETIDSLKQYRRTLVAEIAAKRKQLAGVAARMRTILQDELDSLDDEAALLEDAAASGKSGTSKRSVGRSGEVLPKGYWPYAVARYLHETRQITFRMPDMVKYLEGHLGLTIPADIRNRMSAALSSKSVLPLVKRNGDGVIAIRENITISSLEEFIAQKEREGVELSALRDVCEKITEPPTRGTNGSENVNHSAGSPEANGGVQGLSV